MRNRSPMPIPGAGGEPVHRGMVAVDIASFGGRHDPDVQRRLRDGMYDIVREACATAGIAFDRCHHEDRGDGILLVTGPEVSVETLVAHMAAGVRTGVRRYNKSASEPARMRLRMAVHSGLVHDDRYGVLGRHVNLLFRILEAGGLKRMLDAQDAVFGLIVSDYVFSEIVQYGAGQLEAGDFAEIPVREKETRERAWAWVPGPSGAVTTSMCAPPCGGLLALLLARGAEPQAVAQLAQMYPDLVKRLCAALAQELGLAGADVVGRDPLPPEIQEMLDILRVLEDER